MELPFFENNLWEGEDFSASPLPYGEYLNCTFRNCDFSNTTFGASIFESCTFDNCQMLLCQWNKTALREIIFQSCHLMGSQWQNVHPFLLSVDFKDCDLRIASFFQVPFPCTCWVRCNLQEADFTEAALSEAVFEDCNLALAVFEQSDLQKADFSSAKHYRIDPEKNKITGAKFSQIGLEGLLVKYNIVVQ